MQNYCFAEWHFEEQLFFVKDLSTTASEYIVPREYANHVAQENKQIQTLICNKESIK